MRTLKLTKDSQKNILESLLKRSPNNYTEYESTVNEIINNVKENRDKAVFEYTKKFDKADVDASNIRVTEEEIKEYVNSKDPMDKAGSYGIQGGFGIYVKEIRGEYTNVVGLPVGRLFYEMKKHGIELRG